MTRRVPHRSLARLCNLLSLAGLASACALRSPPEWPAILADVRARYPDVPQLSVAELSTRAAEDRPLFLDARGPDEYAVSHLHGAHLAPDEATALTLLANLGGEHEVVVYCSVGLRSSALAEKLRARGLSRVANLEGGLFTWANAGLPVYRGEERVELVHPYDARWGTLLLPEHRAP